jgi:hypothetical protein
MKLISCTEFVLKKSIELKFNDDCEFAYLVRRYAKFLQLPLTLSMFIPCNENGEVLEEPTMEKISKMPLTSEGWDSIFWRLKKEYQQAQQNVIFEGCKFVKEYEYVWVIKHNGNTYTFLKDSTIEDLIDLNLTITENAINKFKLN